MIPSKRYEESEINGKDKEVNSEKSIWSDEVQLLATQERSNAIPKNKKNKQQPFFPVEHDKIAQLQDGRRGETTLQIDQDNGTLSCTKTGQVSITCEGALANVVSVQSHLQAAGYNSTNLNGTVITKIPDTTKSCLESIYALQFRKMHQTVCDGEHNAMTMMDTNAMESQ